MKSDPQSECRPGSRLRSSPCKKGRHHGSAGVGDQIARSRQGRYRKRQAESRHLEPRELPAERGGQGRRGGIPQDEGTKSVVGPVGQLGTGRSGARRWNGSSYPSRGGQKTPLGHPPTQPIPVDA